MKICGRVLTVLAVLLVLFSAVGCSKLRARDQLNKGVQAYKNAKYEDAIEHFKNAVELDPSLINARLYLATAYAQQYIPGADSPENNRFAEQAIDVFKQVLALHPPEGAAGPQPEGHCFAVLQHEEVRLGQGVLPEGRRTGSQRSRNLLLHRGHRLDPGVSAAHGRARQAWPEAD